MPITYGDTTKLKMVQILPIRTVIIDGNLEYESFDCAQFENPGTFFCECEDRGGCDKSEVLWGTSDPYEPKFCTNHYFPQEQLGYEFYQENKHE